jgi:hypothetical protein
MQTSGSIETMPFSPFFIAWLGQTSTQIGSSQWLHEIEV